MTIEQKQLEQDIDLIETTNHELNMRYNRGNLFAAHNQILKQRIDDSTNSEIEKNERLADIENTIRKKILQKLQETSKDTNAEEFMEYLEKERFNIKTDALKKLKKEIKENAIDPNFLNLFNFLIELNGYRNVDSFWFEASIKDLENKKSAEEVQYWKLLNKKTIKAINKIFNGLIKEPGDNETDDLFNSTNTANTLKNRAIKRLPVTEKQYETMIKSVLTLKSMHLIDMFTRECDGIKGFLNTKHLSRVIADFAKRNNTFMNVDYLELHDELIYNPSLEIVNQHGKDKLKSGYILRTDDDINKCPLFVLGNPKNLDSAILKSFDTNNLCNPDNIFDWIRCKAVFPKTNPLEIPFVPQNKEDVQIMQNENLMFIYKHLQKSSKYNPVTIKQEILTDQNISKEGKKVLIQINEHYADQNEKRFEKIKGVIAQLIEFMGSTYIPEKMKDSFQNGAINKDSLNVFPRYKGVLKYRPTYNETDLKCGLAELKDKIENNPELSKICSKVAKDSIKKRKYLRKQIWAFLINQTKKSPLIMNTPLRNFSDYLFKKINLQIEIYTDKGKLYQEMKAKLAEMRPPNNGNNGKNQNNEHSKDIEDFTKAISLVEELEELTKGKEHPYFEYHFNLDDSVQMPDFEDVNLNNFKNIGQPMALEYQCLDYVYPEIYDKDHDKYKEKKNKRIASENQIEPYNKRKSKETLFKVGSYTKFIVNSMDLVLKNHHFDYHKKTASENFVKLNKNTNYERPLDVRENTKLVLLRILQEREYMEKDGQIKISNIRINEKFIGQILYNEKYRTKLLNFLKLALDETKRDDTAIYRRKNTYEIYLLNILSDNRNNIIFEELMKDEKTIENLDNFLSSMEQRRQKNIKPVISSEVTDQKQDKYFIKIEKIREKMIKKQEENKSKS